MEVPASCHGMLAAQQGAISDARRSAESICDTVCRRASVPPRGRSAAVWRSWRLFGQAARRRSTMRAYLFIKTRVTDPDRYQEYVKAVRPFAERFGSRYIVRSYPVEVLEGERSQWGDFCLLVSEFPSAEVAREFWRSQDYAEIRALRKKAGDVHVVLAEELPADPEEAVRVVPRLE